MPTPKQTSPEPSPDLVSAAAWSAGDGVKQVPLAGLLADDPTLQAAELPAPEWERLLAAYLKTERL